MPVTAALVRLLVGFCPDDVFRSVSEVLAPVIATSTGGDVTKAEEGQT